MFPALENAPDPDPIPAFSLCTVIPPPPTHALSLCRLLSIVWWADDDRGMASLTHNKDQLSKALCILWFSSSLDREMESYVVNVVD